MLQKIFVRISPIWYTVDAGIILLGALIIQYGFNFPPCSLCVGQRFPWILFAILTLVATRAEQVNAVHIRNRVLICATLTMVGSTGFGIYHGGIQYELWDAVVACTATTPLELNANNLLQAIQTSKLVPCNSKDPLILGASLPIWNAIISAYMAISIGYFTWVKFKQK